jgi:hypothetical protein
MRLMRNWTIPIIVFLGLMLGSCSDGTNDAGPGGVSSEDAKALDEAAAKLDSNATTASEGRQQ